MEELWILQKLLYQQRFVLSHECLEMVHSKVLGFDTSVPLLK
jgi:hypothetical protein